MARGWVWAYEGYDPEKERLREALCTLGNGYFATRGAAPETPAAEKHYPGTYVAGCYNRLTSSVQGRQVENEDVVNLPNWLPLRYRIRPAGSRTGPWLTPDHAYLVDHRQWLDLRGGILNRRSVYEDSRPPADGGAGAAGSHGRPPSRRAAHGVHRGGLVGRAGGGVRDRRGHP